jgi:hypothetical protein
MSAFSEFFLMKPDDVKRYAAEVLHRFDPDEETTCTEIGDGNINYVFRVRSLRDGRSVIVKQADKRLPPGGRWTSIGAGSRRRPCSWSPGWRRITSRRSTTMTRPWRLCPWRISPPIGTSARSCWRVQNCCTTPRQAIPTCTFIMIWAAWHRKTCPACICSRMSWMSWTPKSTRPRN